MNDISRVPDLDPTIANGSPRARWRSSRVASFLLVLGCLALLGGLGWYLSHRNAKEGPTAGGARGRSTATVAFAVAKRVDIPIRLEALGTVTPLAMATVRPQVSGVLQEIYYHEGQNIERGQPLALIDQRPFQLALEQANAQQQRDEAELANARVILERNQTLLSQDSIAKQDVDTQQASVKQLQGVVGADRAAVGAARLNLAYSRVVAPISGRVGLRPVDVGNYVATGDTAGIATITQVTPIDVAFTLPADSVPAIQKRVSEGAVLPTTVLDRSRTNALGAGTFLTLDNQIDSQTGTVRAKARFDNSKGALFPNQFVNVQLQLDTIRQAVVVPAAAVRHGPQGDFVYTVAADNTAHIKAVKVGPSVDDQTSITTGLEAGEKVVTEGGDRLTEGSAVRLPGQKPANGQGAGAGRTGQTGGSGQQSGAGQPSGEKPRHAHRPAAVGAPTG
ncbi:MAG: efflux RND transporter periplasmic adaptor subunit [Gammaproteobacteria bacterium]